MDLEIERGTFKREHPAKGTRTLINQNMTKPVRLYRVGDLLHEKNVMALTFLECLNHKFSS
jgi:hypothetical protein